MIPFIELERFGNSSAPATRSVSGSTQLQGPVRARERRRQAPHQVSEWFDARQRVRRWCDSRCGARGGAGCRCRSQQQIGVCIAHSEELICAAAPVGMRFQSFLRNAACMSRASLGMRRHAQQAGSTWCGRPSQLSNAAGRSLLWAGAAEEFLQDPSDAYLPTCANTAARGLLDC